MPDLRFCRCVLISIACLTIATHASSQSNPQTNPVQVPDVIACLTAIEALGPDFQLRMEPRCLNTSARICARQRKQWVNCLEQMNLSMREFYRQVKPVFPQEIASSGSYKSDLKEAEDILERGDSGCDGRRGAQLKSCEFVAHFFATTRLLRAARLAQAALR